MQAYPSSVVEIICIFHPSRKGSQCRRGWASLFKGAFPCHALRPPFCPDLMRNLHVWKTTTQDGQKREVRAEKFGKRWRLQAKVKGEENWTYYDDPLVADLVELRDVLFRKYQRKHLSYDDLAAVEKMITDRGGTWEAAE
jgi:hypothetical protein